MIATSWKCNRGGRLFVVFGCIISLRNSILILNRYVDNVANRMQLDDAVPHHPDLSIPYMEVTHTVETRQKRQSSKQFRSNDLTQPNLESAACLLVMDDNHFLVEWLAYHYHVMNLRHVVIAIDPRSETSPIEIIQRWKNYMNITVWHNYNDYNMPNQTSIIHAAEERVRIVLQNAKEPYNFDLMQHRARQRLFYSQCMIEHQKKSSSSSSHRTGWTLFLDTDEFVSINYPTIPTLRPFYQQNNIPLPSISDAGSVLQLLEMEQKYFNSDKEDEQQQQLQRGGSHSNNITSSPCIQIPRFRYGTREIPIKLPQLQQPTISSMKTMMNLSHYATIRWQVHANSNNYGMNRISKTIIDVNRISGDELYSNFPIVESIHKPLPDHYCARRKLHIRSTDQILIIHHYLGTYEQYSFRNDSRSRNERSDKMYHKIAKLNQTVSSIYLAPWLEGFIQVHGMAQANKFLHNVGVVKPTGIVRFSKAG